MTHRIASPRRPALVLAGLLAAMGVGFPAPARASFHLWTINEVFSNADGSIQYVELFTSFGGQGVLGGHTITADSDGAIVTFTFPSGIGGDTTGKTLLIATPGFANIPNAVTPDYVLPCGPFFNPSAANIVINFASGFDTFQFDGVDTDADPNLPKDGDSALQVTGAATATTSAATPVNYAGTAGSLSLTACQIAGTCEPCDDGDFCNGAETCSASTCDASSPCPGQMCDETGDACVDCLGAGDCDDSNACTDDACASGACQHANNTDACDDGLFCNGTDTCSGGDCVSSGDPCAPDNCLEGTDACGDCTNAADCADDNECTTDTCASGNCDQTPVADGTTCDDDGLFCNGAEACAAGMCTGEGDPCDAAGQTCDEAANACENGGGGGSAGAGGTGGAGGSTDDDAGVSVGGAPDGAVGSGPGGQGAGPGTDGSIDDAGEPVDGEFPDHNQDDEGCDCRAAVGSDDYSRDATRALPVLAALLALARRRRGARR